MTDYRYQALNAQGELVEGELSLESDRAVEQALQRMDCIPLKIESGVQAPMAARRPRRAGKLDLQAFFEDLHDYLESGLQIDQALQLQAKSCPASQKLLQEMLSGLRQGKSLSEVMHAHIGQFNKVQCGIVRIGEETGSLTDSLGLLAGLVRDLDDLRERIRSALAYPSILMVVMLLSMVVLFTVVVPRFAPLFEGMGVEVQGMTRVVMGISDFLLKQGWVLVTAPLLLIVVFRMALYSPHYRRRIVSAALKLPLIGEMLRQYNLYVMSTVMNVLLSKRVPVVQSLELVEGALSNLRYRESLHDLRETLRQGHALGRSLPSDLYPEHFRSIVSLGEETGKLSTAFSRLSSYYYKQLNGRIRVLMTYIEPAIIMLLGLMVGLIVVSMLQTLLSINELVA